MTIARKELNKYMEGIGEVEGKNKKAKKILSIGERVL
jgi:hypothetical protein